MAKNSKIEWCDDTFNPWRGCTKVAAGCANCYAERDSKRFPKNRGIWGPDGTRVLAAPSMWREPLKWNRDAQSAYDEWHAHGMDDGPPPHRPRVFCASLADVFEDYSGDFPDNPPGVHGGVRCLVDHEGDRLCTHGGKIAKQWPDESGWRPFTMGDARHKLFDLIDATPHLDFLVLTKRPENVQIMCFDPDTLNGFPHRKNVWLGCTVSDQKTADAAREHLKALRDLFPVLFVSYEPAIGPVDWTGWGFVDWIISGGESGPHARPSHCMWHGVTRDFCIANDIAYFFKQWGEYMPLSKPEPPCLCVDWDGKTASEPQHHGYCPMRRVGKKAAGRILDGREWNEFPKVGVSV